MANANIDLEAYRGDTVEFPMTFVDAAKAPIDITGWPLFFTIKSSIDAAANDDAAALVKTVTSHLDAPNGSTQVVLTNADTYNLSGEYYYDFQYKDDTGKVKTIMSGVIDFIDDVTRRTS